MPYNKNTVLLRTAPLRRSKFYFEELYYEFCPQDLCDTDGWRIDGRPDGWPVILPRVLPLLLRHRLPALTVLITVRRLTKTACGKMSPRWTM